jgi:L-alanine-DL-glutamate epimerase-like enolase superfamily enzyme
VLFAVQTEDGIVGYGESLCEDPVAVSAYGLLMAKAIVGKSVSDIEAIVRSVWARGRWRFWPHFAQMTFAGIEVACWDALGKTLGVPTRTFFGGKVHDEVDFFGFAQGQTPDALARDAARLASLGHRVIYAKLGHRAQEDEACVAAIRDAVGPDALLRVDPNEAWDVGEAIERIRRLQPYQIDWVEQPVPAGNVGGLAYVRRAVETKIAADQAVFTSAELLSVLEKEAADVVVQGSHDAGGLLRFRQQAFICEAYGVNVNRHAFMETEISFLANLQVASSIPNLTLGNQSLHQLVAERLIKGHPLVFDEGRIGAPDGPGHGFEIDLDAVELAHERWKRDGPYPTA